MRFKTTHTERRDVRVVMRSGQRVHLRFGTRAAYDVFMSAVSLRNETLRQYTGQDGSAVFLRPCDVESVAV
jgi:hypothetical protein